MTLGFFLLIWLFPIPGLTDVIATPQHSVQRSDLFGSCGHLEISQLGSFGEPSISGLVPSNLQYSAQERSEDDPFYTMDYPLVRINSAVITCESRSPMRTGYGTVSVIVEFTCIGVACEQTQLQNRTYSHLFSFVCRPGGTIYETQMSIDGFRASIYLDTTNSVSNTVTASDGSCVLCTNDISVQTDPRFQQETGCLECASACFNVGLRSCVTNIGGGDTTCCSWWYQDRCASSCPSPYFLSDLNTNECNAIAYLKASDDSSTGDHCIGDTLTYNCSSTVPNVFVNLIWTVSYPSLEPVIITYGSNTPLNIRENFSMSISSILTNYTRNLYMESSITLTVLPDIPMNEIEVSCAVSNIFPAVLEIQYSLLQQVPSIQLLIVEAFPTTLNTAIVTLWVRQQEFEQSRAQNFQLSISPQPLLSSFDSKDNTPFNVTVLISTLYNASVTATNCVGSSSSFVLIETVFGPRPYISEERTGVLVISGVNIDVGSSAVNISCSTYSVLPTQLTWSSRNEDNSIPSGISLISLGAQVLNLVWTRPSLYTDSGEYMCTATNTRGSNTATINLLVSIPTNLLAINPNNHFDFGFSSTVLIPLGFNREVFTCIASGKPPLLVEWLKDGLKDATRFTSEISSTENIPFVSSVLTFPHGFNATDTGVYKCVVQDNTNTFESKAITLEHTSDPEPVIDPMDMCQVNTTAYFHIRILDTPCSEWNADQKQNIAAKFLRILEGVATVQCLDCILNDATLLLTDGPTCSAITENAAVFRGSVSTQQLNLTKAIFCALNEWLVTGPIVQLLSDKNYFLDQDCLFKLSSPTSSECSDRNTAAISYNLLAYSSGVILCLLIIFMAAAASGLGTLIRKRQEDKSNRNEIDIEGVIDLDDIINGSGPRRSMYGNTIEYRGNANEAMLSLRRQSLYEGSVQYEDILRYNDGQTTSCSGTEDESQFTQSYTEGTSEYTITLSGSSEFTATRDGYSSAGSEETSFGGRERSGTRINVKDKDDKKSRNELHVHNIRSRMRSASDHKANRLDVHGSIDRSHSFGYFKKLKKRLGRSHSYDTSSNYEDKHCGKDKYGKRRSRLDSKDKRRSSHGVRRNSREDKGRSDKRNSREDKGRTSQGDKRNSQEDEGRSSREDKGRSDKRNSRGDKGRTSQGDKRNSQEDEGRSSREDKGRSSQGDKRHSREDKGRSDKRNSQEDKGRSDKRNSREDKGKSSQGDKRNFNEDKGRSDKRDSQEDRAKGRSSHGDKRNSQGRNFQIDKRNFQEDKGRSDKRDSQEDRGRTSQNKRNSQGKNFQIDERKFHEDKGRSDKRDSQEDRGRSSQGAREDHGKSDKRNSREDRVRSSQGDRRTSQEDRGRSDKRISQEDRGKSSQRDRRNSQEDKDRSDKRNSRGKSQDKMISREDKRTLQREVSAQGDRINSLPGDENAAQKDGIGSSRRSPQVSSQDGKDESREEQSDNSPQRDNGAQGNTHENKINTAHYQRIKTIASESPQADDKSRTVVKPQDGEQISSAMCSTAKKSRTKSSPCVKESYAASEYSSSYSEYSDCTETVTVFTVTEYGSHRSYSTPDLTKDKSKRKRRRFGK